MRGSHRYDSNLGVFAGSHFDLGVHLAVCLAENHYFDRLNVRCQSCGNLTIRMTALVCGLFVVFVLSACWVAMIVRGQASRVRQKLIKKIRMLQRIWQRGGMRQKVKVVVALCVPRRRTAFKLDR